MSQECFFETTPVSDSRCKQSQTERLTLCNDILDYDCVLVHIEDLADEVFDRRGVRGRQRLSG